LKAKPTTNGATITAKRTDHNDTGEDGVGREFGLQVLFSNGWVLAIGFIVESTSALGFFSVGVGVSGGNTKTHKPGRNTEFVYLPSESVILQSNRDCSIRVRHKFENVRVCTWYGDDVSEG
jgi:hypothetical protein